MQFPCHKIKAELHSARVILEGKHLPHGSPSFYVPISEVKRILSGKNLKEIFLCPCSDCMATAGVLNGEDTRLHQFNEKELSGTYATMYAVLIWLRYPGWIHEFQKRKLHLESDQFLEKSHLDFLGNFPDRLPGDEVHTLKDYIVDAQFNFRVRKLASRDIITEMDRREVLPIKDNPKAEGQGAFGEVFAFEVHDDYRAEDFADPKIEKFARKIFSTDKVKDGLNEWRNLIHVIGLRDPRPECTKHLVKTLGSFIYGDWFFIIFPFAQSSLKDYLEGRASLRFTHQELWEQMQGIAAGLSYLHGTATDDAQDKWNIIYHLDLKPANILIVGKTMQISDFGLSRQKQNLLAAESGSNIETLKGYMAYAPPESFESMTSTRGYDLWSLGAIFSEVATYDIEGPAGLQIYRENRRKEEGEDHVALMCFYRNRKVKKAVVQQHKDLMKKCNTSHHSHNLTAWHEAFINEDLIDLVEEMLAENPKDRGSAERVALRLKTLRSTAQQSISLDPNIYTRPLPPDIWQQATSGGISGLNTPPQKIICCNLRETLQSSSKKCSLLLYLKPQDKHIRLRILVYYYQDTEPTTRNCFEINVQCDGTGSLLGIIPLYAINLEEQSDQGKFEIRLMTREGPSNVLMFQNMEDLYSFQAAFLGQYVVSNRSFLLSKCEFTTTGIVANIFHPRRGVLENAILQLWCDYEIPGSPNHHSGPFYGGLVPSCHMVIITAAKLHFIPVTNDIIIPKENELRANPAVLTVHNHKMVLHSITTEPQQCLPIVIPQRHRRCPEFGCAELKFRLAGDETGSLSGTSEDPSVFWTCLNRLQAAWNSAESKKRSKESGI